MDMSFQKLLMCVSLQKKKKKKTFNACVKFYICIHIVLYGLIIAYGNRTLDGPTFSHLVHMIFLNFFNVLATHWHFSDTCKCTLF